MSPKRSPLPTWAKLLIALSLVATIAAGTVHVLGIVATRRWQSFVRQLQTSGEPLTFGDIEALRPGIPRDRNNALVIERIIPQLDWLSRLHTGAPVWVFGKVMPDFFRAVPHEVIKPSRRFLDDHRDLLNELASLQVHQNGRFRMVYATNPFETLLPHLSAVRGASRLMWLQGAMSLCEGKTDRAVGSLKALFHLSNTLDGEPLLISRLRQMLCQEEGVRLLEGILRSTSLDAETVAQLAEELEIQLDQSTLRWSFLGERALFITFYERITSAAIPISALQDMPGVSVPPWLPVALLRQTQLTHAVMLGWMLDAQDDYGELKLAADKIATTLKQLPRTQFLVRATSPSYAASVRRHFRAVAALACARTALAAERYRLDKGSFPTALTELVPEFLDELPIDPFNGQPLRLIENDEGIVIYSVGDDEVDDGGLVAAKKPPQDVGFRLVRPELRGIVILDDPEEP